MKSFQRIVLISVSLCLFLNVSFARTFNSGFKNQLKKNASLLHVTKLKKSNLLLDFDIETFAEEALQEESDSDNAEFNLNYHSPFEFSFDSFVNDQNIRFSTNEPKHVLKLPLFIQFRNLRL